MKKFVMGIVVGMGIMMGVDLFAAGGKLIEVIPNVKKLMINKVEQKLEPDTTIFTYNGNIYVPLDRVAKGLGMEYQWNEATGIASLDNQITSQVTYWDKHLKDMGSSNHYMVNARYAYNAKEPIVDSIGNSHTNYLTLEGYSVLSGSRYVKFPINKAYKRFKATLAFTKEGNASGPKDYSATQVQIFGDDKIIYEIEMNKEDYPVQVDLDISEYSTITFVGSTKSVASVQRKIGLFEGQFMK